eukprot:PhM_4_TR2278/c0_g1_i1/m.20306
MWCPTNPPVKLDDLLAAKDRRIHVVAQAKTTDATPVVPSRRFVTLLLWKGSDLYCVDSACYHAGGPLGMGEVFEAVPGGHPCIRCPSHGYCFDLTSGVRLHRDLDIEDGNIVCKGVSFGKHVEQRVLPVRWHTHTREAEVYLPFLTLTGKDSNSGDGAPATSPVVPSDYLASSESAGGAVCIHIVQRKLENQRLAAEKEARRRQQAEAEAKEREETLRRQQEEDPRRVPVAPNGRCSRSPPRAAVREALESLYQ